ncbi:MAG: YhgE/Pip domain-containing protein [Eubacterium sp.]|nr:YhgE/Pip domain-containing protein [Eubacterium sp.]
MKQILGVFFSDLRRIRTNVVALIVAVGICVVPSLYAWFNIAGSWDPYGSTQDIKIAVANTDAGYKGEIVALDMNLGDQVVSALKENDQLGWVFVDKDTALQGVKSGEYYAAIVIPEGFSADILSLFSGEVHTGEIDYYLNEKDNAIAPKVTDKGATTVQEQIDSTFVEEVSKISLAALETVYQASDQEGASNLAANLKTSLTRISTRLDTTSKTMDSFAALSNSSRQIIQSTSNFMGETAGSVSDNGDVLADTEAMADGIEEAYQSAADGIGTALTQSGASYDKMAEIIDTAFSGIDQDAAASADSLKTLADKLQPSIDQYTKIRDTLKQLGSDVPGASAALEPMIAKLDALIQSQEGLRDKLAETAQSITDSRSQAEQDHQALKQLSAEGKADLERARQDYENNLAPQISSLFESLDDTGDALTPVLDSLDGAVDQASQIAGDMASDLETAGNLLTQSARQLDETRGRVDTAADQIQKALDAGDTEAIQNLLKSDVSDLSAFLASPVTLERQAVYPVENYGSAMAPFYTTLAIWVGGVVLAAMMRAEVSEKTERALGLKPHQAYFGRYMTFAVLGLIQSAIVVLGDLYFLGIQCEHPGLMLLAGWVTSLVYVAIIYTLTVSFGDVGKAIAVVLMVLQVAGSGGSFPVEVLPGFFQALYPLMPFAHSMAAFRECIGGMYQMTYWMELFHLLLFFIPTLLLGLVLRKPVMGLNRRFAERLEDTHLM